MISLEQANAIITAILARRRELDLRLLAVVIIEPGAIIKAFQKEDHGAMIRFELAKVMDSINGDDCDVRYYVHWQGVRRE